MNEISREVAERELSVAESAAPKSPMVIELEAALVQVEAWKANALRLQHEKAKLTGIIEDAKVAFAEINRRASVLANTIEELREMMKQ